MLDNKQSVLGIYHSANKMDSTHLFPPSSFGQDCQIVSSQTKNSSLGKFCRVFQWEMLVYLKAIGPILQPFGIFGHFGVFSDIWYTYFFSFWYVVSRKIWRLFVRPKKEINFRQFEVQFEAIKITRFKNLLPPPDQLCFFFLPEAV
jgi:hypothetical protein